MNKIKRNKGQVMLMSVLLICGVILGVSALASSLVLQQLKKSTAAGESARAIFAADAGIERALWERYHGVAIQCVTDEAAFESSNPNGVTVPPTGPELFDNSSQYKVVIQDCSKASSLGESGRSARAFHVVFDGLCGFGGQLDDSLCGTTTLP